jgi:amino acid adenylation domain-containing protein
MESAQRRPEAIAVRFGDETLRYGELDRLSSQMAHALRQQGVRAGDRVAIYSPKTPGSLVAIHAILKAGGVYVPLDPNAPSQRLAYILGNCGVRCMVASSGNAEAIRKIAAHGTTLDAVVFTDAAAETDLSELGTRSVTWAEITGSAEKAPPANASSASDLAYILYTSGSTGAPKGVMISHRNALSFVDWAVAEFTVAETDLLSSHAPLHFDLSIFDLFAAMRAGAGVALVPDGTSTFPLRLGQWIESNQITIWYSVPSILTLLLLKGRLDRLSLPHLRLVLFAGEVFPIKYLSGVMRAIPGAGFANLYGPTETNVITFYRVPSIPEEDSDPIPIGRACSNTEISIVDEAGQPVEQGVAGELHARGATVAQGYWGDAARTAASFVEPASAGAERSYRTGDIVSLGADGNYRLLGRRDRMIKSRGYRIELDEIESVLQAHPTIKEAAVVTVPDELIGNRIQAFVAFSEGHSAGAGALRDYCLERLPRYMVPESFEVLEELPKTSTGKVDRTRLARGEG